MIYEIYGYGHEILNCIWIFVTPNHSNVEHWLLLILSNMSPLDTGHHINNSYWILNVYNWLIVELLRIWQYDMLEIPDPIVGFFCRSQWPYVLIKVEHYKHTTKLFERLLPKAMKHKPSATNSEKAKILMTRKMAIMISFQVVANDKQIMQPNRKGNRKKNTTTTTVLPFILLNG